MTLSRRSCKLSNCALSLRERLLHFQPSDVYETGSRPEEMLFSWIGLAGYMVHFGGCSVRLRTHDGRTLGVDRPSSQVVEGTTTMGDVVGGRPWVEVGNVSRPTMTVYSPKGKNTGVAVVVFPGGGYSVLAIDLEGTEVCDWLTSRGITCVLVKYRVPDSGPA